MRRYTLRKPHPVSPGGAIHEDDEGEYVAYADAAAVERERDALRAYVRVDAYCSYCDDYLKCRDECGYAVNYPEDHLQMTTARDLLALAALRSEAGE